MEMHAAVLNAPHDFQLTRRPVPVPGPGEVLLRVEASTLCGTDLRLISGAKTAGVRPGVVLGHEIAGRVESVGDGVDGLPAGAQATVSIVVSCNHCPACLAGREHFCHNLELIGYAIDGGLAEYLLVPARAVANGNVVLTPEMPARTLCLAEPLSCVLNGASQFNTRPGDTVVVLGAGPIGLLHTQLAKAQGASQVIVTNRSAPRRELALTLGATLTVDPASQDLAAVVREVTDGQGADVVIVAIGALPLANQALELAGVGGRVNYFAGFPKGSTVEMDPNLVHYKELQVTGGSNARRSDVHRAVQVLASGAIDADRIVTHAFPLTEVDRAVQAVADQLGVKVAVEPR
ncbi:MULTISPECIES: alcohol dehydrogenase catalytic domain-containing protein [unclassified Luteococcus]|uniref:alcohol dehydrogenase catalytic domain-containing protein n=1 Tax=unclassified Luteococcus TaxID=2639923 RepID=UPI00313BDC5E